MNAHPSHKVFYSLDSASSTQDLLREYVQSQRPDFIIVIRAEHQTRGRGQGDRSWHSFGRKALQQSAYFPGLRHSTQSPFIIHLLVSISLVRAIKRLVDLPDLRIKWPNDLYLQDKKVAGILLHNSIRDHHITDTIVGVGVNLAPSKLPDGLDRAGFVTAGQSQMIDVDQLSAAIVNELEAMLYAISHDTEHLQEQYNELLYKRGEEQTFSYEGKDINATVVKVDAKGRLILHHDDQDNHYHYGHITWDL